MSRSKSWRSLSFAVVLACVAATSCDDHAGRVPHAIASMVAKGKPAPKPDDVGSPSAAILPSAPEGADDAKAIFAHAQSLLDSRDFVGLVHTIRLETRRRWTSDIAVALALDSVDDGSDPDIGRRNAKAQARRILKTFGATASVDHAEVNVTVLTERLFDHVRDPDGLLASMLAFADAHDCGFDPPCALGPSGIDGVVRPEESRASRPGGTDSIAKALGGDAGAPRSSSPSGKVSGAASGIVRLFDRVRAPHKIQDVTFHGDEGVALTGAPDFLPVRFFTQNGVTWLDES